MNSITMNLKLCMLEDYGTWLYRVYGQDHWKRHIKVKNKRGGGSPSVGAQGNFAWDSIEGNKVMLVVVNTCLLWSTHVHYGWYFHLLWLIPLFVKTDISHEESKIIFTDDENCFWKLTGWICFGFCIRDMTFDFWMLFFWFFIICAHRCTWKMAQTMLTEKKLNYQLLSINTLNHWLY